MYDFAGVPPERVILGLPYYGMTWATVGSELHAARQPNSKGLGIGRAYPPRTAVGSCAPAGATLDYDQVEQVARLTWFDRAQKTWFQTYYDDPFTLAPKQELAVERGLAGVGIWALGDDAGQPGYWDTISTTLGLGPSPSPSPSASPSPTPSPSPSPTASPSTSAGGAAPRPPAAPRRPAARRLRALERVERAAEWRSVTQCRSVKSVPVARPQPRAECQPVAEPEPIAVRLGAVTPRAWTQSAGRQTLARRSVDSPRAAPLDAGRFVAASTPDRAAHRRPR